jgi:hypothetical protein
MKKASKRIISFIVAWICLILVLHSQAQQSVSGKEVMLFAKLNLDDTPDWSHHWTKALKPVELRPQMPVNAIILVHALAADYYVQNIGFFCKREWEFEKKTHVPLKFRLGSLDYVNHLEGK